MQVEIPGGMATLKDKVDIRGRQALDRTLPGAVKASRKLKAANDAGVELSESTPVSRVDLTESEIEGLQRFEAAGVLAFLKNWSLDLTVPRTIDEVMEMDPDVYGAIAKVTSPLAREAIKRTPTNVDSGMKEDGTRDLDSPTGPSTGSEPGERAEASTSGDQSTTTSPSDTTGIGSEVALAG